MAGKLKAFSSSIHSAEALVVGGIIFPTRRRIYPLGPDDRPNLNVVIMSGDLVDFELSGAAP